MLVLGELAERQNNSDRSAMYMHGSVWLTLAWIGSALDGVLWGARLGELGVGTVVRSRRGRGN